MADTLRIGLIFTDGELSQSIHEQCVGARLAANHTRDLWGANGPGLDQATDNPDSIDAGLRELVDGEGCVALEGALSVPLSIRAAEWAEAKGILYATANNNPLVGSGRRHVFHIGVPSEITGSAIARFLVGERGARRAGVLHTGNEFQTHAASCTAAPLRERGVEVIQIELDADGSGDPAVLERVRDWGADAVMIYDSDTERQVRLVWAAYGLGGLPPFMHSRGILCHQFRDATGPAAEGHFFVDMFLRDSRASAEEQALHDRLAAVNSRLMATASHAFGWDELRLLAEAWRAAGSDAGGQIAYLESLRGYPGSGGPLTFTESDHNGRWTQDPTTIAQLIGGRFTVVSTLDRVR